MASHYISPVSGQAQLKIGANSTVKTCDLLSNSKSSIKKYHGLQSVGFMWRIQTNGPWRIVSEVEGVSLGTVQSSKPKPLDLLKYKDLQLDFFPLSAVL